jgi:hypothetical protein
MRLPMHQGGMPHHFATGPEHDVIIGAFDLFMHVLRARRDSQEAQAGCTLCAWTHTG